MKKKKKEKLNKLKDIDKEVRQSFGKFYIFSIVVIISLLIFPFLIERIKTWFAILYLVFFLVFYIIMIRDLYKKKNNFWATITSILIFSFIIIFTMDIVKVVFFLIK